MEIYLIRHGETDYNKAGRLQGVTDIPLNSYGIELAEKTAKALETVPFDVIFSSPLIRAYETARILRGNRPVPIIRAEELIELSFGEYEGLVCRGEGYNIPDPDFPKFFEDPEGCHAPPGGESIPHLMERTSSFLRSVMKAPKYQDSVLLMASHGAAIRGILSGLYKLPASSFWSVPVHKNCGVTKLRARDGSFEVEFENRIFY